MEDVAKRAVIWANLPGHGHTIAEACAKFGVSISAYRKARKAFGRRVTFDSHEMLLAGLSGGKSVSVGSMIQYFDWINHERLDEPEMIARLDALVAQGLAKHVGEGYALTVEWP